MWGLHPVVVVGIAGHSNNGPSVSQGMFVKRHKLTKEDGSFFTPVDFRVGEEVTIYGRTYFLVDADNFTREYCAAELGLQQPDAMPYPDDPVDTYRATFGLTKGTKSE
jgi:EF-hand domain-containing protein 1